MKNNRLQMLFVVVLVALTTWAQDNNRLQLGEVTAKVGTNFDLPVHMENDNPNIVAAQFEVTMPQGVTLKTVGNSSDETRYITKEPNRLIDHSVRVKQIGSESSGYKYRVMMLSPGNKTIHANRGQMFAIRGSIDNAATLEENQTYPITLQNVVLSDSLGHNVLTGYDSGSLFISSSADFVVRDISITGGSTETWGSYDRFEPLQDFTLTWTVKNIGSQANESMEGWSEQIYLIGVQDDGGSPLLVSNQVQLTGEKCLVSTHRNSTETLQAGESRTYTASFTVPRIPGLDRFFAVQIKLVPNAGSGERESNQSNNTTSSIQQEDHEGILVANRTDGIYYMGKHLYLKLPTNIYENSSGTQTGYGTLERSGSRLEEETVALTLVKPEEEQRISLGASNVTFSRGSAQTSVVVRVANDEILNGDVVEYTVKAECSYDRVQCSGYVVDDERPTITLTMTDKSGGEITELNEGDDFVLHINTNRAEAEAIVINLAARYDETNYVVSRFKMKSSVVLPAGQTSVDVECKVLNDNEPASPAWMTITASYGDYHSGTVSKYLNDDDIPKLNLSLSTLSVSENAGPNAVVAKVSRLKEQAGSNLTIVIRTSKYDTHNLEDLGPSTRLYSNKQTFQMAPGVLEAQFTLGCYDNQEMDGDEVVNVSARVYMKNCGCQSEGSYGGRADCLITVLDDDEEALTLTSAQGNIKEGSTGNVFTVRRNNTGPSPVVVSISTTTESVRDDDGNLITLAKPSFPATVTIPAFERSVDFTVDMGTNGVSDDTHIITFFAKAENYSTGSTWVLCTDQTLPDATIGELTVGEGDVHATRQGVVFFNLHNNGFVDLPKKTQVDLYCGDRLLESYSTPKTLEPGGSMEFGFAGSFSDKPGEKEVYAKVNQNRSVEEVNYENNTSERIKVYIKPLLTVTEINTDQGWYATEEPVVITGKCEGLEVAEADVELYAIQGGSRTVINTKTDEFGRFRAIWDHPGTLAGIFLLGGCMPGEELTSTLAQISLYGMRRTSNSFLTHEMEETESKEYYIDLKNPGNLTLSNIRMVPVGEVPSNIRFDQSPLNGLAANGGEGRIVYHIIGLEASPNLREWQTMKVRIVSDEGAVIEQTLYFLIYPATSLIKANVKNLNTTMTIGQTTTYELVLTNEGNKETGEMYVDLGDLQWLTTATPQRMASLQPGESATAVLQMRPTANMEAHSITTGNLYISSANGGSLSLPFRIETVSEGTGGLTVDVWDEFTTNGGAEAVGPHVSGATVAVLHPVTQQLLRQFVTGDDGTVTFEDLNAGKYILRVTHPKHDSYQDEVYVSAGRTVSQRVFICYSAVTITMTYEPTEIEDEYEIVTSVVFETNVPRPFVAINQPQKLYLDEIEHFPYMYYVTLTNTGMVVALNTIFKTEEQNGPYHFTPLLEGPWDILPQQSVIIPVEITKDEPTGVRGNGPRKSDVFIKCALEAMCKYKAPCVYQDLTNFNNMQTAPSCGSIAGVLDLIPGYGSGWGPTVQYTGGGGGGGGGTTSSTNVGGVTSVSCNSCIDPERDIDNLKGMKSGKAKDIVKKGTDLLRPCDGAGPRIPIHMARTMSPRKGTASYSTPFQQVLNTAWEDLSTAMCFIREMVRNLNHENSLDNPDPINIPNVGNDDWRADTDTEGNPYHFFIADEGKPSWLNAFNYDLAYYYDVTYHKLAYCYHILNDWDAPEIEPSVLRPIVKEFENAYNENRTLTDEDVQAMKPSALTDAEWNKAVMRLRTGLTHLSTTDPTVYVDYDLLESIYDRIQTNTMEINRKGYETPNDMLQAGIEKVEQKLLSGKESVCAKVKLEIKQKLTMTRQAVRGTLTVENGSATEAMQDITLNFVVTDPDGNIATRHIMEITTESLEGFSGALDYNSGWSLGAKETGVATFLFIPTRYAAPDEPVQYTFAGTITFRDPFTGEMMTRELETERLTVNPSPVLDLTYFMQRDIFGDDALTPEVEPIVPSQFSLLINNKGNGDATKVKMLTNQPQIVENEKGLLVDFQIQSSQLNGGDKTMALGQTVATDFGTIPAKSTAYAQWWLTSTQTGHFTEYDVTATHVTSYDNPDLTLLDQVTIHELIHQIEVPGGESQTPPLIGFLCNDTEDYEDMPDQMYLSDGTTAPVAVVASATTMPRDGFNDQYLLTVYPGQEGWNYGSVADPTGGNRRLLKVQRWDGSAGEVLPQANFWQTDRTLVDALDPVYENLLHFCDQMAYGGYNEVQVARYVLTFEAKPQKVLAVSSISGLPQNNTFTQTPVTTLTVNFNKPVNPSTFGTDDITLMHEGEWKDTKDIEITLVNETTFTLDISKYTTLEGYLNLQGLDGYYSLTIQTKEIADQEGFYGETGVSAGWIQTSDGMANLKVKVVPEGSGTTNPETNKWGFFDTVTMEAEPATGYRFYRWTQDGEELSRNATFNYEMFGPATLVAEFTPEPVLITFEYNEAAGTIEGGGSGYYNYDQELTFTAKPKTGYYFAGWEDESSPATQCIVTIDGNVLNVKVKGTLTMRARFEKLAIAEVVISETSDDNVSVFTSQPNGVAGTQFNVKLLRNLRKGRWNTLCLPFDLTEQQINKTWGYGTNLVKLRSMTGNTMNMEYAWNIKAGEPYMIMPEIDLAEANFEFKGTLNFRAEPVETMLTNAEDKEFAFIGTYSPHTWNYAKGEEYYFRETQNTLYQATSATGALNGLRAYFVIPQGVQARIMIAGIETDASEIILPTMLISSGPCRIYNLQGQYVGNSTEGLQPGLYIINGQKRVIK
ncbi:MAG: hypothetical protein IJ570_01035 [Prevotella sp.]|nr:hypothetical protein [Prevotella sp.]MBR1414434.1 hypothetical protein [Prevotella sp.]